MKKQQALKWFATSLVLFLSLNAGYSEPPQNFTEAKKIARYIFRDHRETLYCGCTYDKHGMVNWNSCGYWPGKLKKRAKRIEWEHIVPAHFFAQHLACYQGICDKSGKCCKGRACCRLHDPNFRLMEADLHNLYPAIGEINAIRSNYQFKELPNAPIACFGYCQMKIDKTLRQIEPKPEIRGLIARVYLYMTDRYRLPLSAEDREQYERWHIQYPPDAWEKTWNARVTVLQGNPNPYVSNG